jgi:hypothetical protein
MITYYIIKIYPGIFLTFAINVFAVKIFRDFYFRNFYFRDIFFHDFNWHPSKITVSEPGTLEAQSG